MLSARLPNYFENIHTQTCDRIPTWNGRETDSPTAWVHAIDNVVQEPRICIKGWIDKSNMLFTNV